MLIGLLEATMVVLNDGIKQISKHGISLRIRRVDTDPRVMVLETCTAQTEPNLKLYQHPITNKLKTGVIHLNAIKIPSNVVMVKVGTVLDNQVNTAESGKSSLAGGSRSKTIRNETLHGYPQTRWDSVSSQATTTSINIICNSLFRNRHPRTNVFRMYHIPVKNYQNFREACCLHLRFEGGHP